MNNGGDKDWIWKTILAIGFLGIVYGIGSSNSVSFDKLIDGVGKVVERVKK